jgi:hypothetical protein
MKTGLSLGVMFSFGMYFILSPFFHYHPSDVHAHGGDLQPHHHEGYYHSQELEILAHVWNLHPADQARDKEHHHPHSSPEHDSDNVEFSIENTSLKQKDPADVSKYKDKISSRLSPKPLARWVAKALSVEVPPAAGPRPFQQRSPPLLFA